MEKVLVTGATGFIGLHCIAQLLQQGYSVTGTVRSPNRIEEVKQAISEQQLSTENLSFVEADLTKDEGWNEAVAGCDYVLHVASPFIVGVPKHEDELIIPAVEGTRRVIEAAINEGVKSRSDIIGAAIIETIMAKPISPKMTGRMHRTPKRRPIIKARHWLSRRLGSLSARNQPQNWRSLILPVFSARHCQTISESPTHLSCKSLTVKCPAVRNCISVLSTYAMLLRRIFWPCKSRKPMASASSSVRENIGSESFPLF